MRNLPRLSFAFGFALASAFSAEPSVAPPAWALPAISGDAAGVFTTPGLPEVRWRVTTATAATAGRQRLLVTAEAEGVKLSGEIEIDPATRDGSWRLADVTMDTAIWLPVIAETFSLAQLKDLTLTGIVRLTGEGVLRAGVPDGTLAVTLRDATLTHSDAAVTLEGVSADLHLDSLRPLRASAEQVVTFRTATAGGVTLTDGRVAFSLPDENTLRITQASVQVLGGHMETEPFALTLADPAAEVQAQARLAQIDLKEILPLLTKTGISSAQGRLDGRMTLRWSARAGFLGGEMQLAGTPGAAAPIIRLTPTPGLLTAHMPESFVLLPAWLGPLGRWTAARNPVFAPLRDIELGRTSLRIESLGLRAQPKADGGGHLLRLQLVAQPVEASLVPKVSLDVNVDGPLQELLKMGLKENLSVGKP